MLDVFGGTRYERPFTHISYDVGELLALEAAVELSASFPSARLESRRRVSGSKSYLLRTTTLIDERSSPAAVAPSLGGRWQEVIDSLLSEGYRSSITEALGIEASRVALEIRLSAYQAGGWMGRHTDREDKLFSQNIYLSPSWVAEWGGGLAMYCDATVAEPSRVHVPTLGTSVAFRRSNRSWHEVMEVNHAQEERRAILIHGYRG